MHLNPVPLTYISWSTDFENFYVEVLSTFTSVRQHLRRSLVFSTSEIAASLKPCIVIVPDIPFKHALNPVALTYISRSTDFENFYVKVLSTFTSKVGFLDIRDSCESETLHSNCP